MITMRGTGLGVDGVVAGLLLLCCLVAYLGACGVAVATGATRLWPGCGSAAAAFGQWLA